MFKINKTLTKLIETNKEKKKMKTTNLQKQKLKKCYLQYKTNHKINKMTKLKAEQTNDRHKINQTLTIFYKTDKETNNANNVN